MFKFALAAGIAFEWQFGPSVNSARSMGTAALQALCAALLAWMVLEGVRVLFRAAMALEDRPAPGRAAGRQ